MVKAKHTFLTGPVDRQFCRAPGFSDIAYPQKNICNALLTQFSHRGNSFFRKQPHSSQTIKNLQTVGEIASKSGDVALLSKPVSLCIIISIFVTHTFFFFSSSIRRLFFSQFFCSSLLLQLRFLINRLHLRIMSLNSELFIFLFSMPKNTIAFYDIVNFYESGYWLFIPVENVIFSSSLTKQSHYRCTRPRLLLACGHSLTAHQLLRQSPGKAQPEMSFRSLLVSKNHLPGVYSPAADLHSPFKQVIYLQEKRLQCNTEKLKAAEFEISKLAQSFETTILSHAATTDPDITNFSGPQNFGQCTPRFCINDQTKFRLFRQNLFHSFPTFQWNPPFPLSYEYLK